MTSSSTMLIAAVSASAGLAAGWILRAYSRRLLPRVARGSRYSSTSTDDGLSEMSDEDDDMVISDLGNHKMVIVIRTDLKMGKGKIAAQCCHAACGSVRKLLRKDPDLLKQWELCGQPKVVTKVLNEAELLNLAKQAAEKGLITQLIRDAGRTQIAPGSLTALAVGPGHERLIDQVTGSLKLL